MTETIDDTCLALEPVPVGEVPRMVRAAYRAMMAAVATELAPCDLGVSHWLALRMIHKQGGCTAGELARALDFTSGATTRLIDQLEQRCIAQRTRDLPDRRAVDITLTDVGRDLLDDVASRLRAFWHRALGPIAPNDQHALVALLDRLTIAIRDAGSES